MLTEAKIHMKSLLMFGSIMIRKDSVEFKIIERQLAIKMIHLIAGLYISKNYLPDMTYTQNTNHRNIA